MKKIFITLGVAMLTISVYAQGGDQNDPKKKKHEFMMKLKFGANLANLTGDETEYNPILRLVFGANTNVLNFSDNVNLNVGAEYSMQGAKRKSSDYIPGGGSSSSTHSKLLDYINFPITARYQKSDKGFFAEGGIQPGILLSAKDKSSSTSDIKDQLKSLDVGITIGAGYNLSKNLGFGLRVTPGISNINKEGDYYKNRNMVASFSALYQL